MSEKEVKLMVSKSPKMGTPEHDKWAYSMMRIQLAMYVDDKVTCEECGYTYKNVDDFTSCNPKNGKTKEISFVCSSCWKEYEKKQS